MAVASAWGFRFSLPEGFTGGEGQGRLVYRSAAGEVLSLGGARVGEEGRGAGAQAAVARRRMVEAAIKAIQRDACQPGLEVFVPLSRAPHASGLDTWQLVARDDGGRLFAQAVVASADAVVVVAWDGRNEPGSIDRYFALLESFGAAP